MPPKRLTLAEAAAYVLEKYNKPCTRQTIYNWAKVGLRVETTGTYGKYTTTTWIDSHLSCLGVAPCSVGPVERQPEPRGVRVVMEGSGVDVESRRRHQMGMPGSIMQ